MSDCECLWGVAVAGTQLQYGGARTQLHLVHGSSLCNTYLGIRSSVTDPDPGSSAFLTSGSGMGKKSGSRSGMNNPNHNSKSLERIFFWVKILKFFDADPGSGIQDVKNLDP